MYLTLYKFIFKFSLILVRYDPLFRLVLTHCLFTVYGLSMICH